MHSVTYRIRTIRPQGDRTRPEPARPAGTSEPPDRAGRAGRAERAGQT